MLFFFFLAWYSKLGPLIQENEIVGRWFAAILGSWKKSIVISWVGYERVSTWNGSKPTRAELNRLKLR